MRSALVPCCSQHNIATVPTANLCLCCSHFLDRYHQYGNPIVGIEPVVEGSTAGGIARRRWAQNDGGAEGGAEQLVVSVAVVVCRLGPSWRPKIVLREAICRKLSAENFLETGHLALFTRRRLNVAISRDEAPGPNTPKHRIPPHISPIAGPINAQQAHTHPPQHGPRHL
jgi:hypothetical protein